VGGAAKGRLTVRQAAFIGVGSMVGAGIFSLLGAAGAAATAGTMGGAGGASGSSAEARNRFAVSSGSSPGSTPSSPSSTLIRRTVSSPVTGSKGALAPDCSAPCTAANAS